MDGYERPSSDGGGYRDWRDWYGGLRDRVDTGPDEVVGTASSGGGGGEHGAETGDRIFWEGSHVGHEDVRGGTVGTKKNVGGEKKRDGAGDAQGGARTAKERRTGRRMAGVDSQGRLRPINRKRVHVRPG